MVTSSLSAATMVSLPPPPSDMSDSTMDPELVLDTLDAFNANAAGRYHAGVAAPQVASADTNSGEQPDETQQQQQQQRIGRPEFDPIEFLNQHYHTEQQLVSAIPGLRAAITARLSSLDDNLSTTLRHQAALAPSLARDVVRARNAVIGLTTRVLQVQAQAKKSEEAVLEITRDMKRLDYAKRHLQRTITALKRLHMLLHAAEQLRMAAMVSEEKQPIPRYRAAAHLVDATRELLGHFEGYFASVPKMRQVRDAIGVIKGQLWEGIVHLFREVGFPTTISEDNSCGDGQQRDASLIMGGATEEFRPAMPSSSMVQTTLADACLVIEALGPKSQERFITDFVKDHLREYDELYNPMGVTTTKKKKNNMDGNGGGGSSSGPTPSFKKDNDDTTSTSTNNNNSSNSSLDTVENRFAWYRLKLRDIQLKFANVFPSHWNIHYRLTSAFLEVTSRHLKFILERHQMKNNAAVVANVNKAPSSGVVVDVSALKFGSMSVSTHGGGVAGDTDKSDIEEKKVAALLKALQKTIHFEKEMSAWLSRDFGIVFDSSSGGDGDATGKKGEEKKEMDVGDIGRGADGNDDLEFDDRGRAVPAKSAEGIRIKYERRKRMGGGVDSGPAPPSSSPTVGSVPPLAGIASTIFDEHMLSYVALEERSMEEQLKAAAADNTVDTRGERPVFVSSTNLFIYMKNSLTRCTALTKEKTFFLLQRAFQKKLREYAKMLEKKLPLPIGSGVAKLALVTGVGATGGVGSGSGSSSSTAQAANSVVFRIPPGEEVTVCHVIDTCEYCADTVEALEDLIRDKIGDKYKDKIDMNEEQGAFQDVTAKSLRVLVSGLEQRLDVALKEISRTNWASFDMVGEESGYVRTTHVTVQLFVVQVRELIPSSYFRSFCDKFAMSFASTYYRTLIGLKRISEAGTQQLLLDVYSVKTLLLKLPVMEADKKSAVGGVASSRQHHHGNATLSGGSTIAPAMYTKMVNKEFRKLEVMLKLVGSPREMLVEMFRAQWDCSMDTGAMASDFAMIMTLKGIPRTDHAAMLETLGVDAIEGGTDTSAMTVNIQALQDRGSDVAAKVNADLNQMRQRVDDFRKAFR